jgi:hypothetical protein
MNRFGCALKRIQSEWYIESGMFNIMIKQIPLISSEKFQYAKQYVTTYFKHFRKSFRILSFRYYLTSRY